MGIGPTQQTSVLDGSSIASVSSPAITVPFIPISPASVVSTYPGLFKMTCLASLKPSQTVTFLPALVSSSKAKLIGKTPVPPPVSMTLSKPSKSKPLPKGPRQSTSSPISNDLICSVPNPTTLTPMLKVPFSLSTLAIPKGRFRNIVPAEIFTNCPGTAESAISGHKNPR